MNIQEFADVACESLPDGWEITIHVPKGDAYAEMSDPGGRLIHLGIDGMDLVQQCQQCLDYARCIEGLPPIFDKNYIAWPKEPIDAPSPFRE